MVNETFTPQCKLCGDTYATERFRLGIAFCMSCGDEVAKNKVRTVVPMHKSNYMMITDMSDLKGINNKGGLIK